ncbi:MAG: hypothetical protein LUF27_14510 [Lachnospiraceae bacterium]|nr:hypothetical protein [Lachnospiraceae bacterium]
MKKILPEKAAKGIMPFSLGRITRKKESETEIKSTRKAKENERIAG